MANSHKSLPPDFFFVDEATKESIQLDEASAISLGLRGNKRDHNNNIQSFGTSL